MERRSNLRRPIHLRATLSLGDFKPQSCVISDYCPSGLFLQYGASLTQSLASQPGQVVGMDGTVTFQNPADKQEYQLAIKVARLLEGAMGVMLTAPQGAALAAMERISRVEESRQAALVQSNSTSVILRQCTGTIQAFLKPLFDRFLQELGPSMVQAAEQAVNDAQRVEYLDAEAIFRTQPGRITAQFFQELNVPLNPGGRPAGATAPSAAELSLIEKTEFEHWLTLKVMVTKAETEYRGSLLQLKLRLDKIGYVSDLGAQNPLGPPLIGYAFRDTLVPLKLTPTAEKVCYRLFERTVMKQLEPLYEELNLLMIRAGVLPNLDLSKYLSPKARATEAPVDPVSGPVEKTPASAPANPATSEQVRDQLAHAHSAFTTINSLFGQLDQLKRKAGASPAPVWRPDELQRIVDELQDLRMQQPVVDPTVSLRQQLEGQLRRTTGSRKELPEEQRESVDVVDQFFGTLVRNARLSDAAKLQVKRLELPVLKMLMQDRKLFEKRDTAILAVINRIAELGASGARSTPVHNERVAKLVTRICEQADDDSAVLDEAMAELNEMLERQNLLFRRNVERIAAAAEGAQKVADSKRVVAEEINLRVQGRPVPRAVAGLINGGWRDLLSLTYIRQGPDSPAWRDYLGVLDTLLVVSEDRDQHVDLADLLQIIQEGLASISSNHMPAGNIRNDLKAFLTRPHDEVETVELQVSADQDAQDGAWAPSEVRRRGLQRWLARAQKLRVGDWVRFARDEDDAQYVRLVWIGSDYSRFVFVNHQGMKVVDLDQYKLATFLQRGIMVPDPGQETSVVDQSLDTMVKDVYDQLSHATSHDEVTKLINRKEFERALEAALTSAEPGRCFSVMHLDLRQFKMLNDTVGADAGDQILADIAELLHTLAPESGLVARLGGNEFAVLLDQRQAEALAPRYLKAVQDYRLQWRNRSYGLAVSIGVADLAQDYTDSAQALKLAEQACRRSKADGINRIRHLTTGAEPADQQDRIVAKIAGLRDDLKGERILLRCQKVIPLHGKARGGSQYQIMFTIYDDQGQLIPPYDFVRLAERHNRMPVVDRWVVGHMLDWMAQNPTKLESLGGFSVSLSGQSLHDEKLQEFIFERATQTGAPLDKLCFEISEAAAIAHIQDVTDFMHEMREYGCRFCLTNFGSGLSSYKFLKMLPVDLIRIDGSFVKNLAQDPADQMMIRSMTEMVHFLDKELIATQVEDKSALDLLRSLNVDYAQGYCIEKPTLLSRL